MLGCEVGLSEQDEDEGFGMKVAKFRNLVGGVTITGSDFAQIFTWGAVEAADQGAAIARHGEHFVERSPVVSPIEFEADTLAKLVFVDLATRPFVEDVLVARENCFDSQHERAIRQMFAQQRGQIALRVGKGVVVAD